MGQQSLTKIKFDGRVVVFTDEVPVYLVLAWPCGTSAEHIMITRSESRYQHKAELEGLDLIGIETECVKGIHYEKQLYGRPGTYSTWRIK